MANDWKKLHRLLRDQGCNIVRAGSGHYKVYYQGKVVSSLPASTGRPRSMLNQLAQLRRAGLKV